MSKNIADIKSKNISVDIAQLLSQIDLSFILTLLFNSGIVFASEQLCSKTDTLFFANCSYELEKPKQALAYCLSLKRSNSTPTILLCSRTT